MESRFPAMRVLWLEREFYRGKYEMTDSSHVWTPDLGDEIWDLKGAGIFDISISRGDMHECIRRFHVTSRPAARDYKESAWMTEGVLTDWDRLESFVRRAI
ncbi:hypothetical protein AVEN_211835-1 [Araneus ventricosus]|uniref:Uncharacterized protein n=1 Tax=Araneus ventricosus TaxID=182803 RepID=A0A4Y2HHQ7_ARAVE|nr:hypothetical protein AVEN_211835-1 [Araneus ventricosus]